MNDNYDSRTPHGDLIVKPHQYVYILDETKGHISVIVGPQKMSMAGTDKAVKFNADTGSFDPSNPVDALEHFISSPTGSYVVLSNPSNAGQNHPKAGMINSFTELQHGSKLNLAGPVFFPLWPGQQAKVIEGHNLRSNQYLICRVYDDETAKANIENTVVKKQVLIDETVGGNEGDTDNKLEALPQVEPETNILHHSAIVTGKLFIIKGTEISFYIPPTGIEVLGDSDGQYIRDAVTLEQLEYCILLNENGGKRFERGPQVVFPFPTERFLRKEASNGQKTRRFRAMELNDISGLYIKIIADYVAGDVNHKEGDEIFITGKEQRIYYPRAEHSIIKYDDKDIHHAVAVPVGDAKYVLDRSTGAVKTIAGPTMFLADPRKEVIVRRILNADQSALWYPNNNDAIDHNVALSQTASSSTDKFVTERQYKSSRSAVHEGFASATLMGSNAYEDNFLSDGPARGGAASEIVTRAAKFTKPTHITIDNKYDGAVKIRVWTGYAIQVVNGLGERKVEVGPCVIHLGYDSELESFILSKGKPKTTENIITDVYLRVKNNRITDIVELETKDMVNVSVKLSYRVDFEGDSKKWFNVENYVQYLADHMTSLLRNVAKKYDIEDFYAGYIDIVRNATLGSNEDDKRPGRSFSENGMRLTEVEVLNFTINDYEIQSSLVDSQRSTTRGKIQITKMAEELELDTARNEIEIESKRTRHEAEKQKEALNREMIKERSLTFKAGAVEEMSRNSLTHDVEEKLASFDVTDRKNKMQADLSEVKTKDDFELKRQEVLDEIEKRVLVRTVAVDSHNNDMIKIETENFIKRMIAEADKEVKINGAVAPGLIESMHALAQSGTLEKLASNLAPLSVVRGLSLGATINDMFAGTPYADTIASLTSRAEQAHLAKPNTPSE